MNFGSATGYLWLGNLMGVLGSSSITGSNGVVVSSMSGDGQNELRLQNTANTFSGGLYINGTARVRFNTSDAQLGTPGGIISFAAARSGTTAGARSISSTGGTPRPIELHSAGGGIIRVETGGVSLTVPGLVSGSEQLTNHRGRDGGPLQRRQHLRRRDDDRRCELWSSPGRGASAREA